MQAWHLWVGMCTLCTLIHGTFRGGTVKNTGYISSSFHLCAMFMSWRNLTATQMSFTISALAKKRRAKGGPLPQLQEQLTQESMEGVEAAEGQTSWGRPGAQEPGAKRSRDSDGGSELESHKSLKPDASSESESGAEAKALAWKTELALLTQNTPQ